MTWVRIDDGFSEHPKLLRVGLVGMGLQVAALCYCNRNLTDGFIPTEVVPTLQGSRMVTKMVAAGLWDVAEGGYMIHNYDQYQPTKAQVKERRRLTADRVKRWRNDNVTQLHPQNNGVSNAAPVPVPVPVEEEEIKRQINSSKSSSSKNGSTHNNERAREVAR
jgi:hypothetical protein